VLQNYTWGDTLDLSNFVSFSYTSNLFDIESTSISNIFGTIPVGLPGPTDVQLDELIVVPDFRDCNTYDFQSQSFGSANWEFGVTDVGSNGLWTGPAPRARRLPNPRRRQRSGSGSLD
jgi:hypothetical protein